MSDPIKVASELVIQEVFRTIPIHYLSAGFHQYAPCQETPARLSEDHCELIYIQNGSARIWLDDKEFKARSGQLVAYLPKTRHREVWQSQDRPPETYYVRFQCMIDAQQFLNVYPVFQSPVLDTGEYEQRFAALFHLLSEEYRNQSASCQMICDYLTENVLLLAQRQHVAGVEARQAAYKADIPSLARQYIQRHCTQKLTLNDIAKELFISASRLSHIFHESFGTSVMQALNAARIEQAKGLLRYTLIPVQEVGKQSGFENPPTFNRKFKQSTGMTPTQYRRTISRYDAKG